MSVMNTMDLAPMRELSLDEIDAVSGGDAITGAVLGEYALGFLVAGAFGVVAAPIAVAGGLAIAGLGIGVLGATSTGIGTVLFKIALDDISIN